MYKKNNAAVLWTGGKDSCLALHEAHLRGHQIKNLITLVPHEPDFLAHPIGFMKLQSEALQIPHITIEISEPYKTNYVNTFLSLKEKYFIETLITGDIDEIEGHSNMVKECAEEVNMEIFFPLWKKNRKEIINKFSEYNFQWIFSLVKQPHFTNDWVGKKFSQSAYNDLLELEKHGVDICGEKGEYHSLVLDSELFKKRISIDKFSKKEKKSMHYISIEKISLKDKL
jgi:uncharacterized protein (TIGR00290 family)